MPCPDSKMTLEGPICRPGCPCGRGGPPDFDGSADDLPKYVGPGFLAEVMTFVPPLPDLPTLPRIPALGIDFEYPPPERIYDMARELGKLTIVSNDGPEYMLPLAADEGASALFGDALRSIHWDGVRLEGPVRPGRVVFTTVGGEKHTFAEQAGVSAGERKMFALSFAVRNASIMKVEYETAISEHRGKLLYGSAPVKPVALEAMPEKPTGHTVSVPCSREGCGKVTVYPLGMVDPREYACPHKFDFQPFRGVIGMFVCRNCLIAVDMRDIQDAGVNPEKRYSSAGNLLADEAQMVRDENRRLLAEVGKLSLEVAALERKLKARR